MKHRFWMERLAEQTDLQSEPIPAQPLVELLSHRRVLIENHDGVLEYSGQSIRVGMPYGSLVIRGEELLLAHMSGRQLVICGQIDDISVIRR